MSSVVLDASAIGAVVFQERGAERVLPHLPGAIISTVNLSEIAAKAIDRGGDSAQVIDQLSRLALDVRPFDIEHAHRAASLITTTKPLGLSFGDRACLALGLALGVPVLTAEQRWSQLGLPIRVEVIRSPEA